MEKDKMEIGLKFVGDSDIASSQAYSKGQSIIALTDSRSSTEVYRRLRHLQFLGDPNLQNLAENYLSAYENFSEALRNVIGD